MALYAKNLVDVSQGQIIDFIPSDHVIRGNFEGDQYVPYTACEYVSLNHIMDHYLKLYMKLTTGITGSGSILTSVLSVTNVPSEK